MFSVSEIKKIDAEIAAAIEKEVVRQRSKIILVASENYVDGAILQAVGSPLTNKYAEGYPNKRWYGGCEHVDVVETIAIERAKALFGAEHANVQPHSGVQANTAVFFAMLEPGDAILGMNLSHGGHLSHGALHSISGKYFTPYAYCVRQDDFRIDYDEVRKKALECRPKMIIAGSSAYPRIIDFKVFREIADEVGAFFMADIAHIAGLVAAGLHPSPVPYADFVTSTSHKTLRGPRGGFILCRKQYSRMIDSAVFPGIQGGPLMNVIAAKAICFKEAMDKTFHDYQKKILSNAKALAEGLLSHGVDILTGGTDNHLMLADVTHFGITGREAQMILDEVSITINKNIIPYDKQSPFNCSGIRLGTPFVTTRGMVESDMSEIALMIRQMLENPVRYKDNVKQKVKELCLKYPI